MSNAIANISNALGYDAVETMLASGMSLASCYAFAAAQDFDAAPVSVIVTRGANPHGQTVSVASTVETVRPGKKA